MMFGFRKKKTDTDNVPKSEELQQIQGETVNFENVHNYFTESTRSQDIESMLAHREAQANAGSSLGKIIGNYGWIAVVLVGLGIAIYIINMTGLLGGAPAPTGPPASPFPIITPGGASIS